MKNFFLLFLLALTLAVPSMAQMSGAGYYRVQNTYTGRFIRIIGNTGSIDYSSTTVDLGSLETVRPFSSIVSDPATVIYIQAAGDGYDLYAQGSSTYSIIGYYLKIKENTGGGSYRCYGTKAGLTQYLSDEIWNSDVGMLLTSSPKSRDWYLKPVSQSDTLCFGVQPEFHVGEKYYLSFYASFPFSFASEGMKAYTIKNAGLGLAAYQQITTEVIPAATPVIIECSSNDPLNNKLNLLKNSATAPTGNLLKGAYFCNSSKTHYNRVVNDPATMRVLGTLPDGSLGFVKSTDEALPRNKAYLVVSGEDETYKFVSSSEYDYATGIHQVSTTVQPSPVYNLTGVKVAESSASMQQLPAGVYIVKGEKIVVK